MKIPVAAILCAGGLLAGCVSVRDLVGELRSEDRSAREAAAGRLVRRGARAVRELVEALGDENVAVRESAALALAGMGAPAARALREALCTYAEDREERERFHEAAAFALRRMGPESAALLARELRRGRRRVRRQAAWALAFLGEDAAPALPALVAALRAALDGDHDAARGGGMGARTAAIAIGEIGLRGDARQGIPVLVRALGHEATFDAAAEALGKIGEPALPAVLAALGSEEHLARLGAAMAVRQIAPEGEGAQAATGALARVLDEEPLREGEALSDCATEALAALSRMGPAAGAAAASVARLLRGGDGHSRVLAATALVGLGGDGRVAVAALTEELGRSADAWSGRDVARVARALEELGPVGAPAARPLLDAVRRLHSVRRYSMRSPDWEAASALAAMGAGALPVITEALADEAPCVRQLVTLALVRVRGPLPREAVRRLLEALRGEGPGGDAPGREGAALRRCGIIEVLLKIRGTGDDVGPVARALAEVLARRRGGADTREDRYARACAARALATIGADRALVLPALVSALGDPEPHVRTSAASIMHALGAAAVPHLVRTLDDEDASVRGAACNALGHIGEKAGDAVPALARLLGDEDQGVRYRAAWALGAMGPAAEAAVPALAAMLKTYRERIAASALAWIASEASVGELLKAIENPDPRVREVAAEGLRGLKGDEVKRAERALVVALRDEVPRVRYAAACALAEVVPSHEAAFPVLVEALGDRDARPNWLVSAKLRDYGDEALPHLLPHAIAGLGGLDGARRHEAVRSLWWPGPDAAPAVPALLRALRDASFPDPRASDARGSHRDSIFEALGRIGPEARGAERIVRWHALNDERVGPAAAAALAKIRGD